MVWVANLLGYLSSRFVKRYNIVLQCRRQPIPWVALLHTFTKYANSRGKCRKNTLNNSLDFYKGIKKTDGRRQLYEVEL